MVDSGQRPNKDVTEALERAEKAGLLVVAFHRDHRWGDVRCGRCQAKRAIYSAPLEPAKHAKQIDRFAAQHTHPQPDPPGGSVA
jgi:hypothetical protein